MKHKPIHYRALVDPEKINEGKVDKDCNRGFTVLVNFDRFVELGTMKAKMPVFAQL